jgi:hypothetical protein
MIDVFGYLVLGLAILAIIGAFVKVLMYALDALTNNDD